MRCFYIPRRKGTKLFAHLQILSNFESRILNYEVEKGEGEKQLLHLRIIFEQKYGLGEPYKNK